jgi:hypothetical protein
MAGHGRTAGTCLEAGDQGRDEDVGWEARTGFVEDVERWSWFQTSLSELAVREPQDSPFAWSRAFIKMAVAGKNKQQLEDKTVAHKGGAWIKPRHGRVAWRSYRPFIGMPETSRGSSSNNRDHRSKKD